MYRLCFYCLFRLLWECVFPDFVSKIYDFATPCNLIKATISAAAGQKSTQLHQQQLPQASCTSSSCAVYQQWQQAGWPYYNLAQAKIMIIWLGQKLWLFGSGKNYDYLAQAQIMIIWLRHKLWKFDSSQNYENVAVAPNQQKKRISRLLAPYKRLHRSYTVALCLQFTFPVLKA